MNKFFFQTLTVLIIFLTTLISCVNNENKNQTIVPKITEVDQYVNDIMERYGVPGVAVAVIKNNKVIHENYYGLANIEHNVPVSSKTVFPLLSTTKIPVYISVFKLIEDKKLSLEDEVGQLLADVPTPWKTVKIKYLLSNSSGLPEIVKYSKEPVNKAIESIYNDPIKFNPGENFDYNQTNIWLLDRVIEKLTKQEFEENILQQFSHKNSQAQFSNNMLEIVHNRANRYTFFNDRNHFELDAQRDGEFLNSGNGLNLSLIDFIKWTKKFQNDDFISKETKSIMWKKFNYEKQGPDYSYGWEIHKTNNRLSYGFLGGYTTEYRTYQQDDLTIIWLTNGFKTFYRSNPVVDYIAGIVEENLKDINAINSENVIKIFEKNTISKSVEEYYLLKKSNPDMNVGNTLNFIGYNYLRKNEIDNSITIFKLNIKENPTIWNYYDSLAEAYMNAGEIENAISYYTKASEMNSESKDYTIQVEKLINSLKSRLK